MDVVFKENNIFYNILCFLITENEKLFDNSDKRLYWRTVFHSSCVFLYFYLSVYGMSIDLESNPNEFLQLTGKYYLALLTGWNTMFQTIFVALALLYDILEWMGHHEGRKAKWVKYVRDVVFTGLVVPFTCFVCGMFWSVYAVDRELVFPKAFDEVLPWWFNHCVHTNIMIIILIEIVLTPRRKPVDFKVEFSLGAFFYVGYAVVYYLIYAITNRWLYKLFAVLTWWQIVLFQSAIFVAGYIFYMVQFPLNRLFHKEEKPDAVTGEDVQTDVCLSNNGSKNNTWSLKLRTKDVISEKTAL